MQPQLQLIHFIIYLGLKCDTFFQAVFKEDMIQTKSLINQTLACANFLYNQSFVLYYKVHISNYMALNKQV